MKNLIRAFSFVNTSNGSGNTSVTVTSADDKWEQLNFNIYRRSLNKTKTEVIDNKCTTYSDLGNHKLRFV